jgi:hypothetical protein
MSNFSLSSIEKQVLFKKYVHLGYPEEEADNKIKSFCTFLKDLKEKLKKKKFEEVDINARFKKEFERLCQRLDTGENYLTNLKGGRK